jgi:aryl-alcohol dehydrogenase-like predicted oxidoreductase
MAQLATRWLVGRPAVQSVLVGGSRVDHVVDNLRSLALGSLPGEVSAAIDEVGAELRGPMPAYNR